METVLSTYYNKQVYLPMGVKDVGSRLEAILSNDNYAMSIKKDGSQYISHRGQFISRLGKDKTANVPHLAQVFSGINAVVVGEIYYPLLKSNDVTKVMGSLPEKAIARQIEMGPIHYYLFDILEIEGVDVTGLCWRERRSALEDLYRAKLQGYPTIELAEVFYGSEAKHLLFDSIRSSGAEEGVVFEDLDSQYYEGEKPEHCLYKWKQEVTTDVIITGFKPGKGKYEGQVGAVLGSVYIDDNAGNQVLTEICACSGMDDEVRLDITEHPENYLGKVIEVHAMERTAKRRLRHVAWRRIRDDKPPEDCIWMG